MHTMCSLWLVHKTCITRVLLDLGMYCYASPATVHSSASLWWSLQSRVFNNVSVWWRTPYLCAEPQLLSSPVPGTCSFCRVLHFVPNAFVAALPHWPKCHQGRGALV
jgi:hypothetical protein